MTGINAIIYILSTIPPWYLVDRWGRRFILLTGAVVVSNNHRCLLGPFEIDVMIYRWVFSLR